MKFNGNVSIIQYNGKAKQRIQYNDDGKAKNGEENLQNSLAFVVAATLQEKNNDETMGVCLSLTLRMSVWLMMVFQ